MEPEETLPLPALPLTSVPVVAPDPVVERLTTDVSFIMDRAYLEMVSRNNPTTFLKFAAQVLGMRQQRGGDRAQTVVNVVNAIPRSPLDGLPPGFSISK